MHLSVKNEPFLSHHRGGEGSRVDSQKRPGQAERGVTRDGEGNDRVTPWERGQRSRNEGRPGDQAPPPSPIHNALGQVSYRRCTPVSGFGRETMFNLFPRAAKIKRKCRGVGRSSRRCCSLPRIRPCPQEPPAPRTPADTRLPPRRNPLLQPPHDALLLAPARLGSLRV